MARGAPEARDYTPEFVPNLIARLERLLGPAWNRIRLRDEHGRRARPPNPARHPLAVLVEHARLAAGNIAREEYPGYVPDLLALSAVVEILSGAREEGVFPEIVRQLARPEGYRHDMLVLGMADLLSRYTPYDVRLFSSTAKGERVVDFDFGEIAGARLAVETKGPSEFDGPTRVVSPDEATRAIEKIWNKTTGGRRPQLRPDRPGMILTGGVTLRLESLPVIRNAAERWLQVHGERHPSVHAIATMTFVAVSFVNPPVMTHAGPRTLIHGVGRTRFEWAFNPFYNGPVRVVLAPDVPGP